MLPTGVCIVKNIRLKRKKETVLHVRREDFKNLFHDSAHGNCTIEHISTYELQLTKTYGMLRSLPDYNVIPFLVIYLHLSTRRSSVLCERPLLFT